MNTHPLCCGHSHALFKGCIKCAVTAETALVGKLLDCCRLMGCSRFIVKADEVFDAQIIDVCIISGTLHGKVLAEIYAVGANLLGKFRKGYVVLQIES